MITCTFQTPIVTEIALTIKRANENPKCNFQKVDWKEFQNYIKEKLSASTSEHELTNTQMFYRKLKEVTMAITEAIKELVLINHPSPYMKRWWTPELSQMRSNTRKARWKAYKRWGDTSDEAHEAYRKVRNAYANAIEKSKKEHWDDFLENIDHKSI